MESQPQNPEFRNNPENFHTCYTHMQYAAKSNTRTELAHMSYAKS